MSDSEARLFEVSSGTRALEVGAPLARGGEGIRRAAAALREGALLIHPTSTVYGVGGRPRPELDAAIRRLKGRPSDRPLIRLAASLEEARAALPDAEWSDAALRLAGAFWPGPLTLVLPDATGTGVAVRVDSHPHVRELLQAAGGVLTSTSANATGEPPALDAEAVRRWLLGAPRIDPLLFLLDSGRLPPSRASTVVAVERGGLRLLRAGAIGAEAVASALGGGGAPQAPRGPDEASPAVGP